MAQSGEEMKAAVDAFAKDGEIEGRTYGLSHWNNFKLPTWNFGICEFRPVQKQKLKMPELLSRWRQKDNPHCELVVIARNAKTEKVWFGPYECGHDLADIYNDYERIIN